MNYYHFDFSCTKLCGILWKARACDRAHIEQHLHWIWFSEEFGLWRHTHRSKPANIPPMARNNVTPTRTSDVNSNPSNVVALLSGIRQRKFPSNQKKKKKTFFISPSVLVKNSNQFVFLRLNFQTWTYSGKDSHLNYRRSDLFHRRPNLDGCITHEKHIEMIGKHAL